MKKIELTHVQITKNSFVRVKEEMDNLKQAVLIFGGFYGTALLVLAFYLVLPFIRG